MPPPKKVEKWDRPRKGEYDYKVHITFNSPEIPRILDPIWDEGADEIIYFEFFNPNVPLCDQHLDYKEENMRILSEKAPKARIINEELNYVNPIEIVSKLATHINRLVQKGNAKLRITINLLGAKLTAKTVMEASTIWRNKLEPYNIFLDARYIYSRDYEVGRKQGTHIGKMICVPLPSHFIKELDLEKYVALYLFEYCRKHHKLHPNRDYILRKDWQDLLIMYCLRTEENRKDEEKRTRAFWDLHLLRGLESKNIIKREKLGTDYKILLTERGRRIVNYYLMFLYPIQNIIFDYPPLPQWEDLDVERAIYDLNTQRIASETKSDLSQIKKVHVVFNKKEEGRITDPVLRDDPEILYYFEFKQGRRRDQNQVSKQKNIQFLQEKMPNLDIKERFVNYVDYFEIVERFGSIIKENIEETKGEQKLQVTVNLATGSKLLIIAIANSCHYWRKMLKRNFNVLLNPIYNYTDNYDTQREGGIHQGELILANMPEFEIVPPSELLIEAMFVIEEVFKKRIPVVFYSTTDFIPESRITHYIEINDDEIIKKAR